MNLKTKLSILTLSLLFASASASAAARLVLRSDYGQGHGFPNKVLAPISDRLSGIGHLITREPLGGKFDLVYQENSDGSLAQVFRCPTIRQCADDQDCAMRPEFWICEHVYQSSKKELCRYYVAGTRAYTAAQWTASQLSSGLIVDQIRFLNVGVGLVINNLSEAKDIYDVTKDLIKTSCSSNGLGDIFQQASENNVVLIKEKDHEQVNQMLAVFNTINSPKNSGQFPMSYQEKMKPLIPVILDPTAVQQGLIPVTDLD